MERQKVGDEQRVASNKHSQDSISKPLAIAFAVLLGLVIGAVLLIVFGKKTKERFSAESFASAVLAQNPKVFERLADM